MQKDKIAIIGLGYVGLPLARLLSTKYRTIGFDLNSSRVDSINNGIDSTHEISDELLQAAIQNGFRCSNNIEDIRECNIYIVAVPTPISKHNKPDLKPLLKASSDIGRVISKGDIVIYESTVYPGVTEEECIPKIEEQSALKFNIDFFAGYSPERINPGDKERPIELIKKVTSGSTPHVADRIDAIYNSVLLNGTHKASSIRVAEAAKIIENAQRDVNIAFMNEMAKIFGAIGIDTHEVIDAAASKWNFLNFKPGLVGGHCISVDPYYLIEKAQLHGVFPRIMTTARNLNDSMGRYVATQVVYQMTRKGILVKDSKILILGVTFKENCPDIRNTKVVDIYTSLSEFTDNIVVYDPWAEPQDVAKEYGIESTKTEPQHLFDTVILAVGHSQFLSIDLKSMLNENHVIYDVKGCLDKDIITARL